MAFMQGFFSREEAIKQALIDKKMNALMMRKRPKRGWKKLAPELPPDVVPLKKVAKHKKKALIQQVEYARQAADRAAGDEIAPRQYRARAPGRVHHLKGTHKTEEHKAKLALASSKPRALAKCPKCGLVGGSPGITRYHINLDCGGPKIKPPRKPPANFKNYSPEKQELIRAKYRAAHVRRKQEDPESYKRSYKMLTCPKCKKTTVHWMIVRWHGKYGEKCRWKVHHTTANTCGG